MNSKPRAARAHDSTWYERGGLVDATEWFSYARATGPGSRQTAARTWGTVGGISVHRSGVRVTLKPVGSLVLSPFGPGPAAKSTVSPGATSTSSENFTTCDPFTGLSNRAAPLCKTWTSPVVSPVPKNWPTTFQGPRLGARQRTTVLG